MAGTPLAGTNGRVEIGGLAITQAKYSVKPQANWMPSTNFESVGTDGFVYEEGIFGIRKADVSFSGFWDAAQNPHAAPVGLVAGAILSNVNLYVNKTGNRRFAFASFAVVDVTVDEDVNGMLMISVNGKSNGIIVYPT